MRRNFLDQLDRYVSTVEALVSAYYAENYSNLEAPFFTVDPRGKKFARIVQNERHGSSRSVHSFVDRESGDVLFPSGWKTPAPHARGNIWSDQEGAEALAPHGSVLSLR
jgi:hypothetical protein